MEEPRDSGGQVSDANTGHASDASAELSELETAGPWRKAFDAYERALDPAAAARRRDGRRVPVAARRHGRVRAIATDPGAAAVFLGRGCGGGGAAAGRARRRRGRAQLPAGRGARGRVHRGCAAPSPTEWGAAFVETGSNEAAQSVSRRWTGSGSRSRRGARFGRRPTGDHFCQCAAAATDPSVQLPRRRRCRARTRARPCRGASASRR